MSRPVIAPDFATDAVYVAPAKAWDGAATKVAPGGIKTEGWEPQVGLAAQHLNYILNNHGLWVNYFDDAIINGNFTLKAVQVDGVGNVAATVSDGDIQASGNIAAGVNVGGATLSAGIGGRTIASGSTNVQYERAATLQTVNNTTTTIITLPTVGSDHAAIVTIELVGLKSDGSVGGFYHAVCGFKNDSGVVSAIDTGQVTTVEEEDDAGWGGPLMTITGAAEPVTINIIGKAATTINWRIVVRMTVI